MWNFYLFIIVRYDIKLTITFDFHTFYEHTNFNASQNFVYHCEILKQTKVLFVFLFKFKCWIWKLKISFEIWKLNFKSLFIFFLNVISKWICLFEYIIYECYLDNFNFIFLQNKYFIFFKIKCSDLRGKGAFKFVRAKIINQIWIFKLTK